MSNPIIKVENLGKKYFIRHERKSKYSTLRDVISNSAKNILNKTLFRKSNAENEQEEFWALKDISFEVNEGDRIGIIGRNGAGKSTLLKILSRITEPTTGKVTLHGRVASLLEVGTGFHPELSGRENIYLNGAILGMTRSEIKRKFDEIVDFAEVEKFLDTPVKHYSSGMYVRLAFAVAAHLESEILLVDEVLAVGDYEFQKKCLGKMEEVSQNQRKTVIFVSHNIGIIKQLCYRGLIIQSGILIQQNEINTAIDFYIQNLKLNSPLNFKGRKGNGNIQIKNVQFIGDNNEAKNQLHTDELKKIKIEFKRNISIENIFNSKIDIGLNDSEGNRLTWMSTSIFFKTIPLNKDSIIFDINTLYLNQGNYSITIFCEVNNEISDWLIDSFPFEIIYKDIYKTGKNFPKNQGAIVTNFSVL